MVVESDFVEVKEKVLEIGQSLGSFCYFIFFLGGGHHGKLLVLHLFNGEFAWTLREKSCLKPSSGLSYLLMALIIQVKAYYVERLNVAANKWSFPWCVGGDLKVT